MQHPMTGPHPTPPTPTAGMPSCDDRVALLRTLSPVLDAVGRMNAGTDLTSSLQAVLDGILEAIEFAAGVIDYVRTDGSMEIVAVSGPERRATRCWAP